MSEHRVANPYARRKSPVKASTGDSSSSTTSAAAQVRAGTHLTFSQAFESIEDSTHYQNQRKSRVDADAAAARSEQRAFDQAAASLENSINPAEASSLTDRDHHILLQPHVLYVSTKQRGNGVLNYIRNVPYEFSRMVPDYVLSTTRCALFLSCKYHSLYPNYIHRRIAELKTDFTLRLLLVLIDLEDNANTLLFLNNLAVINNMTLILAWSEEEAARYLETYKALDGKDASVIQKKKEQTFFGDQVADYLGTCKGVNKTDAAQLMSQFGSLRSLMAASVDELALVTGMGEVKVKRLHDAFHKPFSSRLLKQRKLQRAKEIEGEKHEQIVEQIGYKTNQKGNGDTKTTLQQEEKELARVG